MCGILFFFFLGSGWQEITDNEHLQVVSPFLEAGSDGTRRLRISAHLGLVL